MRQVLMSADWNLKESWKLEEPIFESADFYCQTSVTIRGHSTIMFYQIWTIYPPRADNHGHFSFYIPTHFYRMTWSSILWSFPHCLGMRHYVNFLEGLGSNEFHINGRFGTHAVEKKIKILWAVLELPAKQHCQFGPFTKKLGKMGGIGCSV